LVALIYAFQKQYVFNNSNHNFGYIKGGEQTLNGIMPLVEGRIDKLPLSENIPQG